ncbi:MAG: hypothetical protein K6F92_04670, partial [Lachnospiraceae bacterium]|nr:hypothetical protein [Lachnospiraceae bacterium]
LTFAIREGTFLGNWEPMSDVECRAFIHMQTGQDWMFTDYADTREVDFAAYRYTVENLSGGITLK